MNENFDDSFEFFTVRFFVKNSVITLDKKCDTVHRKHFVTSKKHDLKQINETENAINNLQQCYDLCNKINTCFKTCRNIQCIYYIYPEINKIDEKIVELLCNTITCKTMNVFNRDDLYFLKRLISHKTETLKKAKNNKDIPKTKTMDERRRKYIKELFEL